MNGKLLLVMAAAPASPEEAREVLFRFGLLSPALPALLFCDLQDADAAKLPGDDPLCRLLQAGTAVLQTKAAAPRLFCLRRRIWDDAARCYLGKHQPVSPRVLLAQMLTGQPPAETFLYAGFEPASLRRTFQAVLFTDASLSCLPDVPEALLTALPESGFLRARVLPRQLDDEPILSRLTAQGFSLCAPQTFLRHALDKRGQALLDGGPLLCSLSALEKLAAGDAPLSCPLADAVFVQVHAPSCRMLREQARWAFAAAWASPRALFKKSRAEKQPLHLLPLLGAALPPVQMLLLFLAALFGWPAAAFAALILPEASALFAPTLLPGSLVRTAFLPITAACSLDALLGRLLARSRLIRIQLSGLALLPGGCVLCAAVLLPLAFRSTRALVPLLAVGLCWLAAPLLARALASPTRELLPLSASEQTDLLLLARTAFPEGKAASPARRMLTCCGGCMMGLLEPDEAAWKIQTLLSQLNDAPLPPAEWACLLTSAQFIREHLSACDAALRSLPAELEEKARVLPLLPDGGPLFSLLRVLHPSEVSESREASPLDALFLPRKFLPGLPMQGAALVLSQPHGYIKKALPASSMPPEDADARFLFLCAAALGRPFEPLFWRSPMAAPYGPLLSLPFLPSDS